jgi:hypothetical protein
MKRFAGWAVSAGLVLAASAANAQMPGPYRAVSDFDGPYDRPYGGAPPAPPPGYNYGAYGAGPGPALLPPQEVYAVLRDNGFSPLGVPHQRGFVYTIAVIDRSGEDGRLVIDARNGRIIRFVPAWGQGPYQGPYQGPSQGGPYGGNFPAERMSGYGLEVALPPPSVIRGTPQPPAAPVPRVASRAVPLPAPKPSAAGRLPDPTPRQSAAVETRSATPSPKASAPTNAAQADVSPPASATVGEAKPAPVIQPTRQMPVAQGLE